MHKYFALASTLSMIACTAVGPDYRRPTIRLPERFVEAGADAAGEAATERWWLAFDDANLNVLVDRGVDGNFDIRTAIERIGQAEAALRATGLAAQVSGGLTADETQAGGDGSIAASGTSGTLNANFALDVFGGERRAREQALAQYDAARYDVGTARLAFLSSLVGNYIDARYYQEALEITRQWIASRQRTLDFVLQQREAGEGIELDVAQAQAVLNETQARLPSLESAFYSSVYAIATLLSQPAAPLLEGLQRGAAQPRPGHDGAAGVPADLVRNRPDVRSAERDLAAATAAIGVAEAELYPALDLNGAISAGDGTGWSFGPALNLPILDQPALRANRDQAISRARQAELTWRAAVLRAVEEVQSAQTSYLRSQREVAAQQAVVASYERVIELSRATYEAGTTTLSDLVNAERDAANAQLSLAASVRDLASAWVSLQIASGRGWA